MAIFFTLPPDSISYPYILINANNPMVGIRYIVSHRKSVEAVIIDSGIEIFRDPRTKDYPGGSEAWIRRLVSLYDRVRKVVGKGVEVYVTCCDYPDDYHPRSLWIDDRVTNIERTVFNILTCVDWYPDVSWLIPIQGWYRRPRSLLWSLEYLEELGVLRRYRYLAVANLCVEPNTRVIRDGVLYVHTWLREHGYGDAMLHIFGLKISALSSVDGYIHSFDSTAWTRPVSARLHSVFPWSAKSEEERILFFCEYMIRMAGRSSVVVPMHVFEQCLEHVSSMVRSMPFRYSSKREKVEKLLGNVVEDLRKMVR